MARREVVQPTPNVHGGEEHPAWGLIGASRVSAGPPGATLFDSDVRHQHFVVVELKEAVRYRSLHQDRHHGKAQVVRVAMSEAQWASFVSSMNIGDGVPCTIEAREGADMPGLPYEPALAETLREVREKADESLGQIREAFAKVEEKPTKANIRHLRFVIENAPKNMQFAAESLSEHAESVVQRVRADVEAMVLSAAEQKGLDPADLGVTAPLLGSGEEEG